MEHTEPRLIPGECQAMEAWLDFHRNNCYIVGRPDRRPAQGAAVPPSCLSLLRCGAAVPSLCSCGVKSKRTAPGLVHVMRPGATPKRRPVHPGCRRPGRNLGQDTRIHLKAASIGRRSPAGLGPPTPPTSAAARDTGQMPGLPELDIVRVRRWCGQRVPEHARDQVRVECDISPRHLTIVEYRPPWRQGIGPEWTRGRERRLVTRHAAVHGLLAAGNSEQEAARHA